MAEAFRWKSMGVNAVKSYMHGASHKAAVHRQFLCSTIAQHDTWTCQKTATSVPTSGWLWAVHQQCARRLSGVSTLVTHWTQTKVFLIFTSQCFQIWAWLRHVHVTDITGCIMRFGLAVYFKQQLVNTINEAGPFVFDKFQSVKKAEAAWRTCLFLWRWLCPIQVSGLSIPGTRNGSGPVASLQSKCIY